MKAIFQTAFFLLLLHCPRAQQHNINQLKEKLAATTNDTTKLFILNDITEFYSEINPDSTYFFAEKISNTAQKMNLGLEEVHALGKMGYALINKGNYPRALQTFLSAISIGEKPESQANILTTYYPIPDEFTNRNLPAGSQRLDKLSHIYQYMGILYSNMNNLEKAVIYEKKALVLAEQTNNIKLQCITNSALGRIYLLAKKYDSAFFFQNKAYEQASQENYNRYLGTIFLNMGRIQLAKNNQQEAAAYFKKASAASKEQNYFRGVVASNLLLADYYKQAGKKDSVFAYINNALAIAQSLDAPDLLLRSYHSIAAYYNTYPNTDSLVKYQALIIKVNDSLFNAKQVQQFQNIDYDEQQRLISLEKEKENLRNSIRIYALLVGLAALFIIATVLYRNNQQKLKANNKLEQALTKLKTTQKQLIQSEKMASLGELTAGIAHEIQNPLNFVNNFSEINSDLIKELKEEIVNGNIEEVTALANNIAINSEKINHHGKRADAIVKGMLQHSQASIRQKESTDINKLANDYLRLAYNGFKSKENSFNASSRIAIVKDFDETIVNLDIIPQDIGRVILNLINNAFYAVDEKMKQQPQGYEPTVSMSTKKTLDKIEIAISDNGNGIPQKILDKIFQPFFTTKPTGQGTGLGLSLAYDIVKAHGGELTVESREHEGAQFIINLPL